MNALHSILKVTFASLDEQADAAAAPSTRRGGGKLKVVSRQLLRFRLTVTYDNAANDAEKEQAAKAFLAMAGVSSFETAWSYLFSTVQLVPFFLCKASAGGDAGSPQPMSRHRTPTMASPPSNLLANIGNNFVLGTPAFWANHSYTATLRAAAGQESKYGSLHGSYPMDTFVPSAMPSVAGLQTSMPYVTNTASPSFANDTSAPLSTTPREWRSGASDLGSFGGAGMHCEVIGNVQTVAADVEGEATAAQGPSSQASASLPTSLTSSFTAELALPDLEAASLRGMDTTLAVVVLLPLSSVFTNLGVPVDPDQPSILRSVLARSLGHTHVESACTAALVFGSGIVPVDFTEPFLCQSSTSPLSNDRLVLNLSLTNVTALTARLYSTLLDLHSSCVLRDGEGKGNRGAASGTAVAGPAAEGATSFHVTASKLWGEVRPGANLSSMRTIDLLTKLVTITPVVVGEERPPVILHPGETYSFEFVIEVLPQLCYLLNAQSLEYLYERYYAMPHGMTSRVRFDGGGDGAGRSAAAAPAAFSNGSVVTDCYGEAVPAAELRRLLSYSYVSHLFVYYDHVTESQAEAETEAAEEVEREACRRCASPAATAPDARGKGLYLRHPAQWSFGA